MNEIVHNKSKSVNNDVQEIIYFLQTVEEKKIRWNPSGKEWSIMQVISHICESIPFWIEEIESVKKDSTVKIGRGREYFSEDRLAVLTKEYNQNTTIDEAIEKMKKFILVVNKSLETLTNKQLKDETIKFIVDIEIVGHIKGHLHQIKRNLSNREKFDFTFN